MESHQGKSTYGFARPGAKDAKTQLAVNVEVWMDALAAVLDEFDLWGYPGVARGHCKMQLEQLVAVNGVLWGDNVDDEAEHVFVIEETDV